MRLATFRENRESSPRAAAVRDDGQLVDLQRADPQLPHSIKALLAAGPAALERAREAAARGPVVEGGTLLPPIVAPQKILCVGLNYADHGKETGATVGPEPVIFNKLPTTLRGDGAAIELPAESSQVDYEAELVVVIGTAGKHIAREEALRHVAGYTCGHDVSARDWQKEKPGGQWLLGKSFDSFGPCGPHLVTADDIPDPRGLQIELRLNGTTMQSSSTDQLIFPVDELIAYVSQVCTLLPGDLIFTGTPSGVGAARQPPVFLQPGDQVEVEIERIGVLANRVVAAGSIEARGEIGPPA